MSKIRLRLACMVVAVAALSGLAVAQNFTQVMQIFFHGAPQLQLADHNGVWALWGGGNFHIRQGGADRLFFNGNANTAHFSGHVSAPAFHQSSSRAGKTDVRPLGEAEARAALAGLEAVSYRRTDDPAAMAMLGFIAEDVPPLLAVPSRDKLSAMDFAAVLVTVVQAQQREIARLRDEIGELRERRAK